MHDVVKPIAPTPAPTRQRKRRKQIVRALIGLFALFLLIVGIRAMQIRKLMGMKMQMPPTTVSSAQVQQQDWAPTLPAIGSVSAVQGAMVAAELGGVVAEIGFENGAMAKKGEVLLRLDSSSEEAQLKTAEADAQLAKADLDRARELAARKVLSKAEFDAADSKLKQKEGVVDNMRAMIAKKQIRAPFDGQLGIRLVNLGQMITPGQQVVSLQSLDPVFVDFNLPQQELPKLQPGLEVHVRTDALPGRDFAGKLTAINSSVDTTTRNVAVQATLANPDHALRPGMFVKLDVSLAEKHPALVVPGTAISYAPYGDSVFVIEKKKDEKTGQESLALRQQFVRIGQARGDFVEVTQGVKAGQQIVSTGVFKLRNGIPVRINNTLAPKPELSPKPADT
jgi:membrane fusion protein (multidrug efflux system)